MWPLSGLEIAKACGVASWDPAIEALSIAGVTVGEGEARGDELFVALREGGVDGHAHVEAFLRAGVQLALVASDWEGLSALEPPLGARCLVVPDVLAAFRRLAARVRQGFSFSVVAVGGSNGKTTTKEMLAALLSGAGRRATRTPETMNGWSGIPLTLLLREHARAAPPDALVVEIGIDALGAMADHARLVDPEVAVLTTLGPEHLAGLGSAEAAAREELVLFEGRGRRVWMVEDPSIAARMMTALRDRDVVVCGEARAEEHARHGRSVLAFEVSCPHAGSAEVSLSWWPGGVKDWSGRVVVPMAGRHHGEDLAAAFGAGLALGRSPEELACGFEAFVPPPMRCEVRELASGCVIVDDAYNASPASARAALELLASLAWGERARVAVLGDMLDLGEATAALHADLAAPLGALVRAGGRVALVGDAMRAIHDALEAEGLASSWSPAGAEARAVLDGVGADLAGAVVLVKGSRGMGLERVVMELARAQGGGDPASSPPSPATQADLARFEGRFTTACVTGTNGKTTTTSLVAAIVEAAGEVPCRVTTLGAWVGGEQVAEEPSAEAFVQTLGIAEARGVRTLTVETTSQALAQGFAAMWPARVGVFTNLSRDHLDYHETPERYLAAKAQLFLNLPEGGAAVLNLSDPASALLDEVTPPGVRRLGYAARPVDPSCAGIPLALQATSITIDEAGTHASLAPSPLAEELGGRLDLALVGAVHVENALAAALAGVALGFEATAIGAALASFAGVPGRFEIVHRRPLVVVDFAHTPDALSRTLALARSLVSDQGRVVCVFGCGGDRDPGKRVEMGAIAARTADEVIVTNDNPRSEDPGAIADAVEEGARGGGAVVSRILDREGAIRAAIERAAAGDIVVIAGKGHERTQIVGDHVMPFDDVEVARRATARRSEGRG